MSVNFFLTDEDADIAGYLRAKLDGPSDNPHLIRAVTNTVNGPTAGVQVTRAAGDATALAWITDPLSGVDLTAAAWELHVWALESSLLANAALAFSLLRYTNVEGAAFLSPISTTELLTTTRDEALTTGAAAVTTLNDGDRLVFKVLIDDAAANMVTGHTVTVSFNGLFAGAEGDSYFVCPDNLVTAAAMPGTTITRIRRHLQDTASTNPLLTDNEIGQAMEAAIRTYSRDRPYIATGARSGDGSAINFRLPRLWVTGLSVIREIEYPAGEQVREVLDPNEYEIVESVLGLQPTRLLRFNGTTPASGTDNILIRYATMHIHDDLINTIPNNDFDAICWLAASYAADTLAALQAASSDPTIAADSTNHRDGEQRWRSVAKQFRSLYEDHMGQGMATPTAAAGMKDHDSMFSFGSDFLFHGRRRR